MNVLQLDLSFLVINSYVNISDKYHLHFKFFIPASFPLGVSSPYLAHSRWYPRRQSPTKSQLSPRVSFSRDFIPTLCSHHGTVGSSWNPPPPACLGGPTAASAGSVGTTGAAMRQDIETPRDWNQWIHAKAMVIWPRGGASEPLHPGTKYQRCAARDEWGAWWDVGYTHTQSTVWAVSQRHRAPSYFLSN